MSEFEANLTSIVSSGLARATQRTCADQTQLAGPLATLSSHHGSQGLNSGCPTGLLGTAGTS